MNAAAMCEYTHDEFVNGFVKMAVDSIDKLKKKLPELRAELKQEDKFKEVYNYAYNFSREVRPPSWIAANRSSVPHQVNNNNMVRDSGQ